MRIGISATNPSLDAEVDPRFGRCQYFVVVDPDTMEFETLENSNQMASGGAGIASAQLVASKDVQVVLTGNCGPNAYQTLDAAGIEVITGVFGKVRDAIEGYKSGRYQPTSGPTVGAHHGMGGGGSGKGIGMGFDKAMDYGKEQGIGIGYGSLEQDLEALRIQTQKMGQQLNDIMRRLDKIENRDKS
ncbi:NifB/NifX family molybdenum-iron cluster-binding protein [Chloroflexota bacterium]